MALLFKQILKHLHNISVQAKYLLQVLSCGKKCGQSVSLIGSADERTFQCDQSGGRSHGTKNFIILLRMDVMSGGILKN